MTCIPGGQAHCDYPDHRCVLADVCPHTRYRAQASARGPSLNIGLAGWLAFAPLALAVIMLIQWAARG